MTTTRSYREAMPIAAAVAEMRGCAGEFDPRVVDALLERVPLSAPSGAANDPPPALAA